MEQAMVIIEGRIGNNVEEPTYKALVANNKDLDLDSL